VVKNKEKERKRREDRGKNTKEKKCPDPVRAGRTRSSQRTPAFTLCVLVP
tara:strand:+ start:460 stop:609 length:150 start_codon:yes stop_codon:yes gene_type:complete